MKKIYFIITIILLTILSSCINNQSNNSALIKTVNVEDIPGCAVAVIQNGEIIYQNEFGMADLESQQPITSKTKFNLASVSKQFTAYSVLLLEEEGLLSLNDDIKKYFPEIQNFNFKISIKDLISHTSGIREYIDLLVLSGNFKIDKYGVLDLNTPVTNDDILKMLIKQNDLNNMPGMYFTYNNTGYVLLAELVARVSGKSFIEFTSDEIFSKLEMQNTKFSQEFDTELNSLSYYFNEELEEYIPFYNKYLSLGDSNLISNTEDMIKWINFITNGLNEKDKLIVKMTKANRFGYAGGLFAGKFGEYESFMHGGYIDYYSSFIQFIPEINTSIIVLSNSNEIGASDYANKVLDYVFDGIDIKNSISNKLVNIDKKVLKKYVNKYYIKGFGEDINIDIRNGKLVMLYNDNIVGRLENINQNTFINNRSKTRFVFNNNKNDIELDIFIDGNYLVKTRNLEERTTEDLEKFTGKFYCPELDVEYEIILEDDQLLTKNINGDSILLYNFGGFALNGNNYYFSRLMFNYDYTGFLLSTGGYHEDLRRSKNIKFVRI